MPLIFSSLLTWSIVGLLVGRRFRRLWKPGLIGVAIMVVADYFGTRYNYYVYLNGIVYLSNLPLFLFFQVYANSILYLNWLPARWAQRFLYTVCAAALFLAFEAAMYSAGMIAYPGWKLWYSYPLLLGGLSLLAYLSDFVTGKESSNPANQPT